MNESLAASYLRCRSLHRAYGRTYYLATRLLPRWKRWHVHALYGFARYTDDIVDTATPPASGLSPRSPAGHCAAETESAARRDRLGAWTRRLEAVLTDRDAAGPANTGDPILPALLHTIEVFDLDRADFLAFLRSMAMDLTVTAYPTYDDLLAYMEGSAAAIGTMMLPILMARSPGTGRAGRASSAPADAELRRAAREPARQLGFAFQQTNFIRDVREDLARGRVYLPAKDLADFGVTPDDLRAARVTGPVRALIAFEVARAREHYARAAPGIPLLPGRSQACVRAAYRLYGGILDEVVRAGYDVFSRRATVPGARRLAIAAGCLLTRPGRPQRRLPGGAQPEPFFGGGEHPQTPPGGAQPEPFFGGGEHPQTPPGTPCPDGTR